MIETENTIIKAIKKDSKYIAYKKKIEEGIFQFDTKPYLSEIENLHITRKVRFLKTGSILSDNQKNLLESILQNQAIRSRVVEIKLISTKKVEVLESTILNLRSYLSLRYHDGLKSLYSTASDRSTALDYLFKDAQRILNRIETLNEICDLIISDIDTASWGLKSIISVLELSTRRE